jgi:hypothetical protein
MPGTVKVKATPLTGEYDVLVDGERVGMVRKRYEVYSGLRSGNGRGGGGLGAAADDGAGPRRAAGGEHAPRRGGGARGGRGGGGD